MRFRMIALAGALCCALGAGLLPYQAWLRPQGLRYVFPAYESRAESITVSGQLEQQFKTPIYLEAPVIAREVLVSVGDRVQKGDVLVSINTQMTQSVLAQGITVQKEVLTPDLAALGEKYGLPAHLLEEYQQTFTQAQPEQKQVTVPEYILAPMDGIVTDLQIQSGVLTQTGGAVVTVGDDRAYRMLVEINEADVGAVEVGNRAEVTGAGFPGRTYEGVVTQIYPTAKKSGTGANTQTVVQAVVEILRPDSYLKDGFTAEATLYTSPERPLLTLPYQAIRQDENNQEYVYLYREGEPVRRNITTGQEFVWSVEVTQGLTARDVVLLVPQGEEPGRRVLPLEQAKLEGNEAV